MNESELEVSAAPGAAHQLPGYSASKEAYLRRLKRIEGQVRGIARMVDEDKYCIDILTQVAAAQTALEHVAVEVLDGHVRHCVADAVKGGDDGDAKLDELMAAVRRFTKAR
jgi:CsoR family transcriptional regulator, copper-sensing transcriptional repressor